MPLVRRLTGVFGNLLPEFGAILLRDGGALRIVQDMMDVFDDEVLGLLLQTA